MPVNKFKPMLLMLIALSLNHKMVNRHLLYEMELRGVKKSEQNFVLCEPRQYLKKSRREKLFDYYDPHLGASFLATVDSMGVYYFRPIIRLEKDWYGGAMEPVVKYGEKGWPEKKWKDILSGSYLNAYFFLDKEPFFGLIGKNTVIHNSGLLLDNTDPPLDMAYFDFDKNNFFFSYFFSQLKPMNTDTVPHNRFLTGHSIAYTLGDWTFSFSEFCLFFSETNFPDFYFLNPIPLYHLKSWESQLVGETNIIFVPAVKYHRGKNLFDFEFAADELPYDRLLQGDYSVATQVAWRIGFRRIDFPMERSYLSVEYSGATRWFLSHGLPILNWTNHDRILGNLRDSDMDRFQVFFLKHLKKYDFGLGFSHSRYGEGTISEEDDYWGGNLPYPREIFMTGTVEREFGVNPVFSFRGKKIFLKVSLTACYSWNYNNVSGNDKFHMRGSVLGRVVVF